MKKAYIYAEEIELYYGNKSIQRKPGAFAKYQYHKALFSRAIFRQIYDQFIALYLVQNWRVYRWKK